MAQTAAATIVTNKMRSFAQWQHPPHRTMAVGMLLWSSDAAGSEVPVNLWYRGDKHVGFSSVQLYSRHRVVAVSGHVIQHCLT